MGNPAYVYTNLVESASAITISSEDASFPKANLYDRILAKPFKFSGMIGGYIEVDFGASVGFDTVAILGHNLAKMTDGTIKAGAAPNPSTLIGTLYHSPQNMWASVGESVGRYVRITMTDSNTVTSQIGQLVIGVRRVLPRAARWGIEKPLEQSGITHRTYGGVTWDYEHYQFRRLRPTFRFPVAELQDFELLSTRLVRRPFLYIPDESPTAPIIVKVDMKSSVGTTAECFLNPGVTSAVTVTLIANVRQVYTFSGFTGDPVGVVPSFRFDPLTSNAANFFIYSIKVYAGAEEIARYEPGSDFTGWTATNISGFGSAGYYQNGTSTSTDPRLSLNSSIGKSNNAFFVKQARGVRPSPVGPAYGTENNGYINDWYDWSPEFEAESVGLAITS